MLVNSNVKPNMYLEHPIPDTWLAELDRTVDTRRTTDAQGRWTLDSAPAGDDYDFRVMLIHPDYVSDYSWGGLQQKQNVDAESLRAATGTIVMPRGQALSGVVTDADGKAVPDALVIWGDDPYLQEGSQEVRTDEKGRYRFAPLPAGPLRVTVVAQEWAPDQRLINLTPDDLAADFELAPGKKLRLRFIDNNGAAIGGVGVGIQGWRGRKALYNHKHPNVLDSKIPVRADDDGIYEWTWAPADAVTYSFYKEGYQDARNAKLTADGETEYEIVLPKRPFGK
jgi:hypothetical protein